MTKEDEKRIKAWIESLVRGRVGTMTDEETIARIHLPYPVKGVGKHRVVYDLGKGKILKVAKVKKGIRCNRNEVSLYKEVSSRLRRHLCEVLDHGKGWVVMKKMNAKLPSEPKYAEQLDEIRDNFLKAGVQITDLYRRKSGKPKRENLRLDKKKDIVVIIDYANQIPLSESS